MVILKPSPSSDSRESVSVPTRKFRPVRVLAAVLVSAAALVAAAVLLGSRITESIEFLASLSIEDAARTIEASGPFAAAVSILLMTAQSVLAPLPAFAITAANGMVFGPWVGSLISWSGGMAGALVAFGIGRLVWKVAGKKILSSDRVRDYARRIGREYGFRVVLTARLLPFISFDLVSYAAGLGEIGLGSFVAATGLGMIPGTILYTLLGDRMRFLDRYSWVLFLAFAAAILVLAARKVYASVRAWCLDETPGPADCG